MSSNIDKSLDEIIKEDKKEKKREMLKKKKQEQQKPGKNVKNQRQGNAANGTGIARKGQGRPTQSQKPSGTRGSMKKSQGANQQRVENQQRGVNQQKGNRQRGGNQQKGGKPRVLANKLKNRQAINNAGKQMLNRVKKAQGKRPPNQNRQNQQMRQKDARQNILDRRRGMQSSNEVQGNRNTTRNKNRQISNPPPHQGQNKRQKNRRPQNPGGVNELRVSVANAVRQPPQNRVQQPKKRFNINRSTFAIGKTGTTLNERFSGRKVLF